MHSLVSRYRLDRAFFAGDDAYDESVFDSAGPNWLTVRVGQDVSYSRARFFVDSQVEMPRVLDEMIRQLRA